MGFGPDDMEHIGMHFSNADIGCGTQHISNAETAADMSHFATHKVGDIRIHRVTCVTA